MACGKKLFLSLLVRALRILYPFTLLDFRGEKSILWGWVGFIKAALDVEVLHTGQLTPGDVLGSADNPPQRLAVSVRAAAVPGCEAGGQEALLCLCRSP